MFAKWFQDHIEMTDEERESLVNYMHKRLTDGTAKFGTTDDNGVRMVIITTGSFCVMACERTEQGCKIIVFECISKKSNAKKSCWFNKHSLKSLGELLRSKREIQVDFQEIWENPLS